MADDTIEDAQAPSVARFLFTPIGVVDRAIPVVTYFLSMLLMCRSSGKL